MVWLLALLAVSAEAAPGYETRCGWVENPTPGNWSLMDHDGEWEIGIQGGRQAEGPDFPDFRKQ